MLRLCFTLLLLFGMTSVAAAQEPPEAAAPESPAAPAQDPKAATEAPKGPHLSELMKRQTYREAWEAMLRKETLPLPDWVTSFVATLDSPPVPSFEVPVGSVAYTMAFTCKPNDCEDKQLFVLFAPEGRHAWALLLVAGNEPRWLGNPDNDIKGAILGSLE